MKRFGVVVLALILLNLPNLHAAENKTLDVNDLFSMQRLSNLDISPDGDYATFTVARFDMKSNKQNKDVWLINLKNKSIKQLTTSKKNDFNAKWCPSKNEIAFLSNRDGAVQVFLMPAFGGEARKLTDIETGISDFIWSKDGKSIAYTAEVKIPSEISESIMNVYDDNPEMKARVIDNLFYRYWNYWLDGKRSHLFLYDLEERKSIDLTPGNHDTPPLDLGSGHDFTFSPDMNEIAFVRNVDPVVAISTNNDIFTVNLETREIVKITENKATDNHPVYSPDGNYLAYKAMSTPDYEADQYDIILLNLKTKDRINLTNEFDRSILSFKFANNGKYIYFNANDEGRNAIYRLKVSDKKISKLIDDNYNSEFKLVDGGKEILFLSQSIKSPAELFISNSRGGRIKQLTFFNDERLKNIEMNDLEDFWFSSFDDQDVHGLLLKPPFFDENKKYPLIFLIHGGPQGMWADQFHYRWNAQMFAAEGYVVAMVNFRGSKGYGSKFCQAVSKDWGGGPYEDLMSGLDYLINNYDFIDEERMAAAGASYGGYMINWIAGHTDRFKALVSHAGVFDLRSKYGSTEELWFPEWEFNGPPYQNPEQYDKFSPSKFAQFFKTPTLVVHGANDFRVPESQGFQMFTALQRNNVPSRLLYFPDEDHFVGKPQNARLWWTTVHEWIAEWINK